ncbi:MAG TPA: peptide deformylase [Gemmatimonadales bacterium]|nr:peptide deformylase [Gemmatimonadales bacterium]
MTVRHIRQLGDPILRTRCEPIQDPKSAATRLVADDLRDTLGAAREKYNMGRALAAPQIGAPVRLVFVQIDKQRWTMVNPEITDVGPDDFQVWDDCFSFPNLLVRVNRAYQVTLSFTDLKGKPNTLQLWGARRAAAARDRPPGRHPRARPSHRARSLRVPLRVGEAARAGRALRPPATARDLSPRASRQ